MRYCEHRARREFLPDSPLNQRVGMRIYVRGRLIQHQYAIVSQDGSR